MQKHRSIQQLLLYTLLVVLCSANALFAQDPAPKWTPAEQRELFGYCDKPELMKQLKISAETADRIGDIDYWITIQQQKIIDNTNDTFATPKEIMDEAVKKYKAMHLDAGQIKTLTDFKHQRETNPAPCAMVTLTFNHIFDTITTPRALLQYKAVPNRKNLIDKIGINGKQADLLFETEVWKQKESLSIAAIPETDFNRVRKTYAMYKEREQRYRTLGLTDEQIDATIQYFTEHQLSAKK